MACRIDNNSTHRHTGPPGYRNNGGKFNKFRGNRRPFSRNFTSRTPGNSGSNNGPSPMELGAIDFSHRRSLTPESAVSCWPRAAAPTAANLVTPLSNAACALPAPLSRETGGVDAPTTSGGPLGYVPTQGEDTGHPPEPSDPHSSLATAACSDSTSLTTDFAQDPGNSTPSSRNVATTTSTGQDEESLSLLSYSPRPSPC
jgi:hypothetical protein